MQSCDKTKHASRHPGNNATSKTKTSCNDSLIRTSSFCMIVIRLVFIHKNTKGRVLIVATLCMSCHVYLKKHRISISYVKLYLHSCRKNLAVGLSATEQNGLPSQNVVLINLTFLRNRFFFAMRASTLLCNLCSHVLTLQWPDDNWKGGGGRGSIAFGSTGNFRGKQKIAQLLYPFKIGVAGWPKFRPHNCQLWKISRKKCFTSFFPRAKILFLDFFNLPL